MSNWVTLPVETITNFQGKTLKTPQLDDDLEPIFDPIQCPACEFSSTNLTEAQAHFTNHEDIDLSAVRVRSHTVDLDTPHLIFQVLVRLANSKDSDDPLTHIQKNNDSYHAGETWKAAWTGRGEEHVTLHKKQYTWLHDILERKLPKGEGEESLTVATYIFRMNTFASLQALTLPEDRNADQNTSSV